MKFNGQELKFNIGFIRKMDELYSERIDFGGFEMQFGTGLASAEFHLQLLSVPMLSDIILAASQNMTQDKVDAAIEKYAEEHGSLEKLFKEVGESLKKSPVIVATLKGLAG